MIISPYNFVPLSDKVVSPFWANHISHDIPFKDAQSGKLTLKIKAESPIYVRNGMPRNAAENDLKKNDFNNFNNRYFIPGSSVKGMLRSVMEIMSFGRMKNKVNDVKYSVRDFQNNDIYPKTEISNKAECGWLYKIGDEYFIDECGKPGRVSHKNLDKLCTGQKISEYYKNASNVSSDKDKSAQSKNEKFKFGGKEERFTLDYESAGRSVYKIDIEGKLGKIVMTGQSSVRKEPIEGRSSGKHLEFIFWKKEPTKTPVTGGVIKNFFFAYYNHDKNSQKDDWKWRKPQLDRGEKIPVFYRTDPKGNFIDIGLTMLFKITYEHSVIDLIKNQQGEANKYDLAEAIFGFTEGEKALKGRVHVGHAFATNQVNPLDLKTEVLAGPKASYYPNYIEQSFKNEQNEDEIKKPYQTFMNNNAQISGWKRYPIHSSDVKRNPAPVINGKVNEKVATKFTPLPTGAEFALDIAYHNLRKDELGALISAITFHNTKGLFHSIGSAKPLGYGKISIELSGIEESKKIEMLKSYEAFMDYSLGNSTPLWFQSLQIKELFAMAKPGDDDEKLKYMALAQFAAAKGRGKYDPSFALQKYSAISRNNIKPVPLNSEVEFKAAKKQFDEEKKVFENPTDINRLNEKKINIAKNTLKNKVEELKAQLLSEIRAKQGAIREQEDLQRELSSGLNLNAVNNKNTIESLGRALKYWTNTVGGDIGESEVSQIKRKI